LREIEIASRYIKRAVERERELLEREGDRAVINRGGR
jgi:hypothetical protein